IYGNEGSLHLKSLNQGCSVWPGIIQAIEKLKTKGIDLYSYSKLVVGNGHSINFWHDKWYDEVPFKDKFKRCFNLELQKDISVALKMQSNDIAISFRRRPRSGIEESQFCDLNSLLASVVLSDAVDRWSWTLCGHGEFSVKSVREVIDQQVLITSSTPSRWSKAVGGVFKFPFCKIIRPGCHGFSALGLIRCKNWCWRRPFLLCGGIFGSSEMQLYSLARSLSNE
nr:RNA-directed DNA polymerase, eukaryota, reverse transcriptase zinc-binding domain protein [Tanacetum cinerariifolium]